MVYLLLLYKLFLLYPIPSRLSSAKNIQLFVYLYSSNSEGTKKIRIGNSLSLFFNQKSFQQSWHFHDIDWLCNMGVHAAAPYLLNCAVFPLLSEYHSYQAVSSLTGLFDNHPPCCGVELPILWPFLSLMCIQHLFQWISVRPWLSYIIIRHRQLNNAVNLFKTQFNYIFKALGHLFIPLSRL